MSSGLVGVLTFSLSLPANRIAAASFDPFWIAAVRAALAALLAGDRPSLLFWRCSVIGAVVVGILAIARIAPVRQQPA